MMIDDTRSSQSTQSMAAPSDAASVAAFVRELDAVSTIEGNTYVMMLRESSSLDAAELGWLARLRAYLDSRSAKLRFITSPMQQRALAEAGFLSQDGRLPFGKWPE